MVDDDALVSTPAITSALSDPAMSRRHYGTTVGWAVLHHALGAGLETGLAVSLERQSGLEAWGENGRADV